MSVLGRRGLLGLGLGLGGTAALGGCGFEPLYMPAANGGPGIAQRELAAVTVGIIPDRPGQLLREALQERLERGATGVAQLYDLSVAYGIGGEGIAIQQDSSTTRIRLVARATWTLNAEDTSRKQLSQGTARSVDDYNVLDEQYFAADLGNDFAARRLAGAIADQITIQLAAFFRHRAAVAAKS